MSALGDYRRFSITISGFKTTHEARVVLAGLDAFRLYADAAIAELEAKIERGCCANCDSCTRVGFCLNGDARVNVRTDYPMQSDFGCRYWTARVTK